VSVRGPAAVAILAALSVAPSMAGAQGDSALRLGTGTGFQTSDGGVSRFEFGQFAVPPVYDVIRSRGGTIEPGTVAQPLANLTGTVGNLSWDVGISALALPSLELRSSTDGSAAAYQGRLGVGYDLGPVTLFGGGSLVPSPGRGVGNASYVEGGASVTTPHALVFGARVGYQWLDNAAIRGETAETVDWSLGVSREMFGFTFSLNYGGSEPANARSRTTCDTVTTVCDQRLYFSIDRRF
jgi:hypothetical protein